MTIERTTRDDGYTVVKWVSCPYCERAIGPQESFKQHYRYNCPGNPDVETETEASD